MTYGKSKKRNEWKDLVNNILKEMVKDVPNWRALLGSGGYVESLIDGGLKMNTTQLRKFFDVVKKIDTHLREGSWDSTTTTELWKLVPAVKYSRGRGHVSEAFEYFISKAVEIIDESENKEVVFRNFEMIFESMVAYHKYKEKSASGR